jgi:phosphoribosyl 1,2-cyclic phosphodiesterase
VQIRFWGVRGSVPRATPGSIGFGCNTACIEVSEPGTGAFLVLDAGSGIVGLGESLTGPPRAVPIVLSHYHWDHVLGLPFFTPFYRPGWSPVIVAPALDDVPAGWIETLFAPPFFSIAFNQLPSPPAITVIGTAERNVGGFRVSAHPLTHPGGALAYRVQGTGTDVVYLTDHEFGDRDTDQRLATFARNAAAIVVDAHFTPDELTRHKGWGHSSWQQAAEFAAAVGAGHLWLFHHKPGRSDVELDDLELRARRVFPATTVAREGTIVEV